MADTRTKNVFRNSGATSLYKFIHAIAQFVLRTAFIRFLGAEYTAVSTVFTDVLTVLSLMELGVGSAMLYALYKPFEEKDQRRISALMLFYKTAYTTIGIGIMIAGGICTFFLDHLIKNVPDVKEDIRLIFIFYVVTSACSYFAIYKSAILRAAQKSSIISAVETITQIVEIIVEVILLFVFRNYMCYLVTRLVFVLAQNLYVSHIAQSQYGHLFSDKKARLEKAEVKSLFRDVYSLSIYKLSAVVLYSTDSIVISSFVGTVWVGLVGNYQIIINGVRSALDSVLQVSKPSVGNLAVTSNAKRQEEVFLKINFITFWGVCFFCCCFVSLLSPFVGKIWLGDKYVIDQAIVIALTTNFFMHVMAFPQDLFRAGNGLFVQGKYRPLAMSIINIALDILLVKRFGILGVLYATTIARLVTQAWFDPYLLYKHIFKKSPMEFYVLFLKRTLIVLACCFLTWQATNVVRIDQTLLNFGVRMIIAFIIPNLICFLLYHNSSEFRSMQNLVKKAGNRFLKR